MRVEYLTGGYTSMFACPAVFGGINMAAHSLPDVLITVYNSGERQKIKAQPRHKSRMPDCNKLVNDRLNNERLNNADIV